MSMGSFLILSPPIAFLIFIIVGLGLSYVASRLGAVGTESEGKYKAYACGQSSYDNHVRPDYRQFFPVAYFFTIMHVLVLVVATVPTNALTLPLLYVAVGVLALVILFRR